MNGILAHQGGWDELLWFTVPVAIAIVWVRWAEKRGRAAREAKDGTATLPDRDADT